MTIIRKTVRRETRMQVCERGTRNVIVSIEPPGIVGFRLKGTRRTYSLTADALYWLALKAHLAAERREKAKAKKPQRGHAAGG